jgi:hypothetical protein
MLVCSSTHFLGLHFRRISSTDHSHTHTNEPALNCSSRILRAQPNLNATSRCPCSKETAEHVYTVSSPLMRVLGVDSSLSEWSEQRTSRKKHGISGVAHSIHVLLGEILLLFWLLGLVDLLPRCFKIEQQVSAGSPLSGRTTKRPNLVSVIPDPRLL